MSTYYVICFKENSEPKFETCPDLDIFKKHHPNAIILYQFDSKNDIQQKESDQFNAFRAHCYTYGFAINDYLTHVKIKESTGQFIGFNPKNRKYVCKIKDERTNEIYYIVPEYIREKKLEENG